MIHVLAIITAKAGMRDKILEAFHANMPAVHAEKGCIEYGRDREMGESGGAESARHLTAHGRLRGQDPRHDCKPRDPRAAARVRAGDNRRFSKEPVVYP